MLLLFGLFSLSLHIRTMGFSERKSQCEIRSIDISLGWTCSVLSLSPTEETPQKTQPPGLRLANHSRSVMGNPFTPFRKMFHSHWIRDWSIYYVIIWLSLSSILCVQVSCAVTRCPIHCRVSCVTASAQLTIWQVTKNMRVYSSWDLKNTELEVCELQIKFNI